MQETSPFRTLRPIELSSQHPNGLESTATDATSAQTSFSTLKGSFDNPGSPPPSPSHSHNQFTTPTKPSSSTTTNGPPQTHLPPTPATTPLKTPTYRKRPSDSQSSSPAKRPHHPPSPSSPSPSPSARAIFRRLNPPSAPKFSIAYKASPTLRSASSSAETTTTSTTPGPRKEKQKQKQKPAMSEMEIERVVESILRQVDWEEVSRDVASNRAGGGRVYRRWVRGVLCGDGANGKEIIGGGEGEVVGGEEGREEDVEEGVGWRIRRRY